jgi:type II secretory pathway predicted ATPase ExeA
MPFSSSEISRRLEAFDAIEIPHPRLVQLTNAIGDLEIDTLARISRNDARSLAASGRPVKFDELWVMPLVGPSGSGKSFSIRKIVEAGYQTAGDDGFKIPILPVTLRSSTKSPRQLQHQILEAYGDPSASLVLRERDFSEALANEAIRKIARVRGTTVIILDEAHNLLTSAGHRTPLVMAKAIKSLVNDGLFSVVLSGTDKITPLLTSDAELRSREREPVHFRKLDLTLDDCRYFLDFVAHFERKMKEGGVIDKYIGLTAGAESCATTYEMADGVIGIVVRLMRLALLRGFKKKEPSVDWNDIAHAYRAWIAAGTGEEMKVPLDPFKRGPQKTSVDAMTPLLPPAKGSKAA